MIWAAALSEGHGITLVRAHYPHWQDISSGSAIYNMEKHTECNPHKICFENLRAFLFYFFLSPPFWAATLNILCICFLFILHCTAPHILKYWAICSAFTSFSVFTVWGVAFLAWLEVCSASVSQGLCSILPMGCTWCRHGTQPVPAWSDAHALYTSKGES